MARLRPSLEGGLQRRVLGGYQRAAIVLELRHACAEVRVGRAEEFADLAAYLLSDRASYVTGAGINLDGGLAPVT